MKDKIAEYVRTVEKNILMSCSPCELHSNGQVHKGYFCVVHVNNSFVFKLYDLKWDAEKPKMPWTALVITRLNAIKEEPTVISFSSQIPTCIGRCKLKFEDENEADEVLRRLVELDLKKSLRKSENSENRGAVMVENSVLWRKNLLIPTAPEVRASYCGAGPIPISSARSNPPPRPPTCRPLPPVRKESLQQPQKEKPFINRGSLFLPNGNHASVSLPSTSTAPNDEANNRRSRSIGDETPLVTPLNDLEVFYESDLKFIENIGQGAQSSVALVSTKVHRKVAAKYFNKMTTRWKDDLTKEIIAMLRTMSHPNIVQTRGLIYESKEAQFSKRSPTGFLMEYMRDGSVHSALYESDIVIDKNLKIDWIRQAASALTFLHQKSIIHRDIKPANMLLTSNRKRLKLADFGLSKHCPQRRLTANTADTGTLVYMAPEVFSTGKSQPNYDEKCDIYSLGITFWEMLHCSPPYETMPFLAVLKEVVNGTRPSFSSDQCDDRIIFLISRMWHGKKVLRPTAEEIRTKTREWLDESGDLGDYE